VRSRSRSGRRNAAPFILKREARLLEALDAGRITEAHLDVFRQEPLAPEHPYWQHPRVRLTPHVAALMPYAVACKQVAEKIRRLQAGKPVSGVVDRLRGY
jgi:glyoxylate/hydroxypyruvate reductase